MTELMVSRQQTFPMEYPLLAELSGSLSLGGYDPGYTRYTRGMAELAGDRDTFHGKESHDPAAAERPSPAPQASRKVRRSRPHRSSTRTRRP